MNDPKYSQRQSAAIHQQLIGGVIERSLVGENWSGMPGFGFEVRMPTGELKTVFVLSDPEGNGAGCLEINGEIS